MYSSVKALMRGWYQYILTCRNFLMGPKMMIHTHVYDCKLKLKLVISSDSNWNQLWPHSCWRHRWVVVFYNNNHYYKRFDELRFALFEQVPRSHSMTFGETLSMWRREWILPGWLEKFRWAWWWWSLCRREVAGVRIGEWLIWNFWSLMVFFKVTQDIESILKPKGFALTKRGTIAVKGKGDMVTTTTTMITITITTIIINMVTTTTFRWLTSWTVEAAVAGLAFLLRVGRSLQVEAHHFL